MSFPKLLEFWIRCSKLVDPKNQLLVQYLDSIESSNPTGVIPPKVSHKRVEGKSKGSKALKKKKQVEQPQVMEEECVKETIAMKTGVLKCTKKPTKKPSDSPIKTYAQEQVVESVEPNVFEPANPVSSEGGPKKVKQLQFTRRGVLVHKVLYPRSPSSKKHRALDVDQQLKLSVLRENVTVKDENNSDSARSDIRIEDYFIGSPQKDTHIKSTFEEVSP
ncbi:unnamed protein product [Lactuca saligna]|uniref:Uncharacterized protein n=1 Tax=Lactuca saligna TaxID=75948 RepID=A0AA35Y1D6_LACSI|nr:unnamed protein product [Lactuca saligna]